MVDDTERLNWLVEQMRMTDLMNILYPHSTKYYRDSIDMKIAEQAAIAAQKEQTK